MIRMTDEFILDTILFQTAILHQPFEAQMSPTLVHELMLRFFTHVGTFSKQIFGEGKEKYSLTDNMKKKLEDAINKKKENNK